MEGCVGRGVSLAADVGRTAVARQRSMLEGKPECSSWQRMGGRKMSLGLALAVRIDWKREPPTVATGVGRARGTPPWQQMSEHKEFYYKHKKRIYIHLIPTNVSPKPYPHTHTCWTQDHGDSWGVPSVRACVYTCVCARVRSRVCAS